MEHGVDGPEGAVLGNGLDEAVRGNDVRLGDVLEGDGSEVGGEALVTQVDEFFATDAYIALEASDARAVDDLAVFDRKVIFVKGSEHVFAVDDFGGRGIESVDVDAAVDKGVAAGGEVGKAVADENAAVDRPGGFGPPVSGDAEGVEFSAEERIDDRPGFGDFGADVVGFEEMEAGVGDKVAVFVHGREAGEAAVAANGFEEVMALPRACAVFGEPGAKDKAAAGFEDAVDFAEAFTFVFDVGNAFDGEGVAGDLGAVAGGEIRGGLALAAADVEDARVFAGEVEF